MTPYVHVLKSSAEYDAISAALDARYAASGPVRNILGQPGQRAEPEWNTHWKRSTPNVRSRSFGMNNCKNPECRREFELMAANQEYCSRSECRKAKSRVQGKLQRDKREAKFAAFRALGVECAHPPQFVESYSRQKHNGVARKRCGQCGVRFTVEG